MSRYIDANKLQGEMMDMIISGMYGLEDMVDAVIEAPTVDAVPIEQIEAFIDWLERNRYTLLKKAIIKALHDYRTDGERKDGERRTDD